MKLHCFEGDHNAAKIIALANAVGSELELNYITDPESSEFLSLSPLGKSPVFESDLDPITNTNTILRYIARSYKDKGFAGLMPKEEAQIDHYLEICSKDLDPIIEGIYKPYLNKGEFNNEQEKLLSKLSRILLSLEDATQDRNYLVGYGLTLADVVVSVSLSCPFKEIYDHYFAHQYPNLNNYLKFIYQRLRLENLPEEFKCLKVGILEAEELIGGGIDHFNDDLVHGSVYKHDEEQEKIQVDGKVEKRNGRKRNKRKKGKRHRRRRRRRGEYEEEKGREDSESSLAESYSSREMRKLRKKKKRLREKLRRVKKLLRKVERELESSSSSFVTEEESDFSQGKYPSRSSHYESRSPRNRKNENRKRIKKRYIEKRSHMGDAPKNHHRQKFDNGYSRESLENRPLLKHEQFGFNDQQQPQQPTFSTNKYEYRVTKKITEEKPKLHFYPQNIFPQQQMQVQMQPFEAPPIQSHTHIRGVTPPNPTGSYYRSITPQKSVHSNAQSQGRSASQNKVFSGKKIVISGELNQSPPASKQHIEINHSHSASITPAEKIKGVPKIAQSYKTVDMSLLNLRANFNTATPDKKEGVILEFEEMNKGKKFYSINLTKDGNGTDINRVDELLREILPDMIVARVGELGIKKFVKGGLAFTDTDKADLLDKRLFEVEEQDLRNPEVEKTILAALQNVMRTPSVDI